MKHKPENSSETFNERFRVRIGTMFLNFNWSFKGNKHDKKKETILSVKINAK